jgi:hypothetical protein
MVHAFHAFQGGGRGRASSVSVRLVVYDRTCVGRGALPGLSRAWRSGATLYRGLGRVDAAFGASSWDEALTWLAAVKEPVRELQYWGHGRWGRVLMDREALDASAFGDGHRLRAKLDAVREKLTDDALVWLRTCEAFGARAGHDFARRLADFSGARVAGHTFVIGVLQSGLHGLRPGHAPDWPLDEGIAEGTPDAPARAHGSGPRRPRTITCFDGAVPEDWFA